MPRGHHASSAISIKCIRFMWPHAPQVPSSRQIIWAFLLVRIRGVVRKEARRFSARFAVQVAYRADLATVHRQMYSLMIPQCIPKPTRFAVGGLRALL